MKNLRMVALTAALANALGASPFAAAESLTADLVVQANIKASCTLATKPVVFTDYNPRAGTDHLAEGALTISCLKDAAPSVTLGDGKNFDSTGKARRMKHGTKTDLLPYELYLPSANTANATCGATAATTWDSSVKFEPQGYNLSLQDYKVCGLVKAGWDVAAGDYEDTVVATITF